MLNIEDLVKENTNEEGVVNYDAVNQKIAESTISKDELNETYVTKEEATKQTQAVASKMKKKINSSKNTNNEQEQGDNEQLTALQEQLNAINEQLNATNRENAITKFKNKAKNMNVSEQVVEQLINSGVDLEGIDLEVFKTEKIEPLGQKKQTLNNGVVEDRLTAAMKKASNK